MKLLKNLLLAAGLLASSALSAHAVILTGFGDSEYHITFSDFTPTQTRTSLNLSGSDFGSGVYGTLDTPITIDGSASYLTLTGTYSGSSSARFDIMLFDEDGDSLNYFSYFNAFPAGVPATIRMDFLMEDGVFNGPVVMIGLVANGIGSSVNLTLDSVAAVPEPSTWMLLGASVCVLALLRRRKLSR